MRIAAPSRNSRLWPVAWAALERLLGVAVPIPDDDRNLTAESADGTVEVVLCRGVDIPRLVARGCVDGGLTGYDVAVETCLATGVTFEMFSMAPARTSTVVLAARPHRGDPTVVYTDYPYITTAWSRASRRYAAAEVVAVHGSVEGMVRVDDGSAGVVLVTTGATLRANGLEVVYPLLSTDLCYLEQARARGPASRRGGWPRLRMPAFCAPSQR